LSVQALAAGAFRRFEPFRGRQCQSVCQFRAYRSPLLVAIAVNGLHDFATKTDWGPNNCLRTRPKIDYEIDSNYGSRRAINSK